METLHGHLGPVTSLVRLTPGHLSSGSVDCTINIWNFSQAHDEFECERSIHGHHLHVLSMDRLDETRT
jgi:hypothetical protein